MTWNISDSTQLEHAIFEMKYRLVRGIGVRQGMTVVDAGCGQGGFTVSLARVVGETGRVLSVDISEEYFGEFTGNLKKWDVARLVTFVKANVADLRGVVDDDYGDMVASFRLLEELRQATDMPRAINEMARVTRKGGKVCLIEIDTEARNKAEETYVRLHRESGDFLFEPAEIMKTMKEAGLAEVHVSLFDTDIWFSPELAKRDLGFAQVWFDKSVEETLGPMIDGYGMKYPRLNVFTGVKSRSRIVR